MLCEANTGYAPSWSLRVAGQGPVCRLRLCEAAEIAPRQLWPAFATSTLIQNVVTLALGCSVATLWLEGAWGVDFAERSYALTPTLPRVGAG